jgi:plasmid stabilization system protein ParE
VVDYSLVSAARGDLWEIWHFIAEDNEAAATRVVRAAFDTFEQLAVNPGLGHPRTFAQRKPLTVRLYPVIGYRSDRVVYREIGKSQIEVLAVAHTGRNLAALLRRR